MKRLVVLTATILLTCLSGVSVHAQTIDEKAFGKLPVLYNGRVTTIDHYAQNVLLRVAGATSLKDADGNAISGVHLLLDLMAGKEEFRAAPVVQIENAALKEIFELPKGRVRHFSINDIVPRLQALQERTADIQKSTMPPSDDDRAVLEFADRLEFLSRMMAVFTLPDLSNAESMIATLKQGKELERQAIPFVVPPAQAGGEWSTLTYAVIASVADKDGTESNPAGRLFARLIVAYKDGDAAAFNGAVREMTESIKEKKLADCPIQFTPPRQWFEVGTPRLVDQYYFSDARAFGTTLATLQRFSGADKLKINVNFFPAGTAKKEQIINMWRQGEGRPPLADDQIQTEVVKVAGQDGWRVDIETPEGLANANERMRAIGVTLGTQTWVIVCSGPKDLMTKHLTEFDQFVGSFKVESPEAVDKWLALQPPMPIDIPSGTRFALAIVADKQDLWLLTGTYFPDDMPEDQLKRFRATLKSIRLPRDDDDQAASRLPFRWTLPAGWQQRDVSEGLPFVVAKEQPIVTVLDVVALKAEKNWSLPLLVNQWRSNFRLPDLPADKINGSLEKVSESPSILLHVTTAP